MLRNTTLDNGSRQDSASLQREYVRALPSTALQAELQVMASELNMLSLNGGWPTPFLLANTC